MEEKAYVESLIKEPLEMMTKLRLEELERGDICPSVGKEIGAFLKFLVEMTGSRFILEVGTSTGYSALWLGMGAKMTGGHVDTLEMGERLFREAVENIKGAGMEETITCHHAKGEAFLEETPRTYDFIFIDCATGSYAEVYEKGLKNLSPGGLMVMEDVLFAIRGKRKRQKDLMTEFNEKVMNDPRVDKTFITIGDGLILCS